MQMSFTHLPGFWTPPRCVKMGRFRRPHPSGSDGPARQGPFRQIKQSVCYFSMFITVALSWQPSSDDNCLSLRFLRINAQEFDSFHNPAIRVAKIDYHYPVLIVFDKFE